MLKRWNFLETGFYEGIKFGEIVWPTEEATFLNAVCEKERFYGEISQFVDQFIDEHKLDVDSGLLQDIMVYQQNMIPDPYSSKTFSFELDHNLHDYFLNAYLGDRIPLTTGRHVLTVTSEQAFEGDLAEFAKQVVWYGRKGGRFRHANVVDQSQREVVVA